MFTNAIVRTPSKSFVNGITTANLGLPDYNLAIKQHQDYINALIMCGLKVKVLPADEEYPDSTFVEDTALLTKKCAIISNPGAPTRKGEIKEMKQVLKSYYSKIEKIKNPGTVEPGDIMMVGDHFYIGLSERTNKDGAAQMISSLNKYGYSGSTIFMKDMLHLKTGVAYLENNNLLAYGEFLKEDEFRNFNIIEIDEDESYAANCIWVNNYVIVPKGFPKTRDKIVDAGYSIIEVDVSEFRKLDGGLSCLSLRF
ncbi:MAG: N(G),N(G)-dimethylarginine dimethylaminohydrolase [Ignavibacteriae bacterium]|nr:N(G),N(G)-dimethylarginine dimethylaminohydrolase [Ignavibacteriota bacterium]MCB0746597.1 N(G),N(G)-dimethylarginine dimethylaminohydrolase [Ignavibacteriota bacterium]MCB0751352.1 N(G),N(G)-dimethylarginine dimethylaminohydrolase [Ignavibacteriota bacterium]